MSQELGMEELVELKRKENNLPFILAVYQAYDELVRKEIESSKKKVACQKGCTFCCYQLISCTEEEIDEVIKYIMRLPKKTRRPLIVRLKKFVVKWYKYYKKNEELFNVVTSPFEFKPIRDWLGKPCPFLNESSNSCDIYPVRTIDCRGQLSFSRCSKGDETGVFRPQAYLLASSLIMERQKKIGPFGVTPVHYWLAKKLL